ncbi:MAG: hypothetical protein IJ523_10115 [Succinivibrionaceae bacterium]|nr:hypothetical protein [Succinivibrionaceae bacterium]
MQELISSFLESIQNVYGTRQTRKDGLSGGSSEKSARIPKNMTSSAGEIRTLTLHELEPTLGIRARWSLDGGQSSRDFNYLAWRVFLEEISGDEQRFVSCEYADGYRRMLEDRIRQAELIRGSGRGRKNRRQEVIEQIAGQFAMLPMSGFVIRRPPQGAVGKSQAAAAGGDATYLDDYGAPGGDFGKVCGLIRRLAPDHGLRSRRIMLMLMPVCAPAIAGGGGGFGSDGNWRAKFMMILGDACESSPPRELDFRLQQTVDCSVFEELIRLHGCEDRAAALENRTDAMLAAQDIRTRQVYLLTEICASCARAWMKEPPDISRRILEPDTSLILSSLVRELVILDFDTSFICRAFGVSNKVVQSRRNSLAGECFRERQRLAERWDKTFELSDMEILCHQTLFFNILLLMEARYRNYQRSPATQIRKTVAAMEMYLSVLAGTSRHLEPLPVRRLSLFALTLADTSPCDYVSSRGCRLFSEFHLKTGAGFPYQYNYQSNSCGCCFCRKLKRTPLRVTDAIYEPGDFLSGARRR